MNLNVIWGIQEIVNKLSPINWWGIFLSLYAEKQAQSIMKKLGGKKLFTLFAGTPIMGKDCIPKIVWLKEERPDIFKKTYKILDVNGYLKYKCTKIQSRVQIGLNQEDTTIMLPTRDSLG